MLCRGVLGAARINRLVLHGAALAAATEVVAIAARDAIAQAAAIGALYRSAVVT